MELPAALVTALHAVDHELLSALPDAPVRPDRVRPRRTRAVRRAFAAGLVRAAHVIAPA
ncbi:hypothetical protein [Symbioplanes lichenis]|uniref:hypothetical protein n=1 Tax=Symbioplanes lichenis TaxID=1629072 RepID=UPI002739AA67|nr:hypothetical protein [Actinoplanes lichenis]